MIFLLRYKKYICKVGDPRFKNKRVFNHHQVLIEVILVYIKSINDVMVSFARNNSRRVEPYSGYPFVHNFLYIKFNRYIDYSWIRDKQHSYHLLPYNTLVKYVRSYYEDFLINEMRNINFIFHNHTIYNRSKILVNAKKDIVYYSFNYTTNRINYPILIRNNTLCIEIYTWYKYTNNSHVKQFLQLCNIRNVLNKPVVIITSEWHRAANKVVAANEPIADDGTIVIISQERLIFDIKPQKTSNRHICVII